MRVIITCEKCEHHMEIFNCGCTFREDNPIIARRGLCDSCKLTPGPVKYFPREEFGPKAQQYVRDYVDAVIGSKIKNIQEVNNNLNTNCKSLDNINASLHVEVDHLRKAEKAADAHITALQESESLKTDAIQGLKAKLLEKNSPFIEILKGDIKYLTAKVIGLEAEKKALKAILARHQEPGSVRIVCNKCKGSGSVSGFFKHQIEVCPKCKGKGVPDKGAL